MEVIAAPNINGTVIPCRHHYEDIEYKWTAKNTNRDMTIICKTNPELATRSIGTHPILC
jgi:hypothetical protein